MSTTELRRLRYRLKTQGMCELDVWLAPLDQALHQQNIEILPHISQLLQHEAPELQAMMHGKKAIPAPLQAWLQPITTNRETS